MSAQRMRRVNEALRHVLAEGVEVDAFRTPTGTLDRVVRGRPAATPNEVAP